ncbi:MAG: phosphate acyltransferase PlsX [Campylobacterales bacterium]
MVRVAIDAMGGDFGPSPIVKGLLEALKSRSFEPVLVGDPTQILELLPKELHNRIEIVEALDVIDMSDGATDALKRRDSSIYKACELVREGKADAVVSAGHSGATMSLATLRIGRAKSILRPAIATLMPTDKGNKTLVLDVGANVDAKPEHLYQFALMGATYAQDILGRKKPRVGLLANGEEEGKGNEVVKETHKLLKSFPYFVGNVEGNNIFDGSVDVVVCDGFVGNILLKTSEGVAETIGKFLKNNIRQSPFATVGALFMQKVFKKLKKEIDYAEYGGAPLLGINGCVIISHGKSNAKAIKNAIFQAIGYVEADVTKHIEKSLVEFSQ